MIGTKEDYKKKDYLVMVKPRGSKKIALAGLSLSAGMIALPFIPFKKAHSYKLNFKGGKK